MMSLADDPAGCVSYIATELRGLVGAKTVIVYECPRLTGEERHRAVAIFPERRRQLATEPLLLELAELSHDIARSAIVEPGSPGRAGGILATLGAGETLVLPLRYAQSFSGVVILLDLIDAANRGNLLATLDRLSPVMALILRNAWLYGNLERAVADRTRELEARSAELLASLREKEAMLKEIHHRVKNNLQIVSSLLYLHAGSARDEETRALFEESQGRIAAMALVHEELYRSGDLARVDMSEYLSSLARRLLLAGSRDVVLELALEPVRLPPDAAIPCGLAVAELVTNSLKHAFGGGRGGRLRVAVAEEEGRVGIEVSDDGPGLGDALDREEGGHIGLSIVRGLAGQLHGRIESLPGPGARLRLTFALPGG